MQAPYDIALPDEPSTAIDQINQDAIDAGETYRHRPPESMRPRRREVITEVGRGVTQTLDAGVTVEWLAGEANQSRNLATGLLRCQPGSTWSPHRHPHDGSMTLLHGSASIQIDQTRHALSPLDGAVVPPGIDHAVINTSRTETAVFHVAYPNARPVTSPAPRSDTPPRTPPRPYRIHRHATAERYQASRNATFINYFNDTLTPGIPMCGGYGLFLPGGRLPAHLHDFDESICIVQGAATCLVEGRRYTMKGCATALQPRGRVHYFINETDQPMAMIWVYAGPTAERLVVDERCAVMEGVAWP